MELYVGARIQLNGDVRGMGSIPFFNPQTRRWRKTVEGRVTSSQLVGCKLVDLGDTYSMIARETQQQVPTRFIIIEPVIDYDWRLVKIYLVPVNSDLSIVRTAADVSSVALASFEARVELV